MFSHNYLPMDFYGKYFKSTKDFKFTGSKYSVEVQKNTFSDGTSSKPFTFLVPQFGVGVRAAFIHDGVINIPQKTTVTLLETGEVLEGLSWKEAAEVYYEALQACSLPEWRCRVRYSAVLVWGWIARK